MELPIILGIAAFLILAVMFALLRRSSKRDEQNDPITQEIIIKAHTGPVTVNAPINPTQEKED